MLVVFMWPMKMLFITCCFVQGLLRSSTRTDPLDYGNLWCDLLNKYTTLIPEVAVKRSIHISLLDSLINRLLCHISVRVAGTTEAVGICDKLSV